MKFKLNVLSAVVCLTVLAGANAAPPLATANPLKVTLTPAANGTADVVVTNTGGVTARILKWQLPQTALESPIFSMTRDGKPIAYEGYLVKRGAPQPSDFLVLRPGESYRTSIDLSQSYDMSKPGQYSIQLDSPLNNSSFSGRKTMVDAQGRTMSLRTPVQKFWNDGVAAAPLSRSQASILATAVTNGVNYTGCTASRTTAIGTAIASARNYSENAKNYLQSGKTGARYTTWFGTYNSSRYATVTDHFENIDVAMDQNNGQITMSCSCAAQFQGAFAYVRATEPYKITVCSLFWAAANTGTDSRAGTLIHEMSHFNILAGTDDYEYGQTEAKKLARTNPSTAIYNADSHEYFAENTPSQN